MSGVKKISAAATAAAAQSKVSETVRINAHLSLLRHPDKSVSANRVPVPGGTCRNAKTDPIDTLFRCAIWVYPNGTDDEEVTT